MRILVKQLSYSVDNFQQNTMINQSSQPSDTEPAFSHIPVLGKEIITGLNIKENGHYLDTTVGGGGHSRLILEAALGTQITAVDQDEDALIAAKSNLAEFGNRVNFVRSNFAEYDFPANTFDGIIADLGVSSYHLDNPERGFSFRYEADLDMRMDRRKSLRAAEIINHWDEVELADIFYKYGEERLSRRIAKRIVENRPFNTTTQLAEAISYSVPRKYRYGRIHPATRAFQGLRIAVNNELKSLEILLEKAPLALVEGGKIAIISFHSLEDRIVKHSFKDSQWLKVLTKKPITAQEEEISTNPRSRSAKLRISESVSS